MKKALLCIPVLTLLFAGITFAQEEASHIRMKLNGFGDIVYGETFGNPASPRSKSLKDQYNDPDFPHGMHDGFALHALDFLHTVYLDDNITIQTELQLESSRGSSDEEPHPDLERLYIDYKIDEKFCIQAGLMFTPIGYINRNLYSRAWLMNSIYFYPLVESDAGYVPTHFIGAVVYGNIPLPAEHSLKYMIGGGMPRPTSSSGSIFNTSQKGYQATAFLEWYIPGAKDFRLGLSGYSNNIHTWLVTDFLTPVDITLPGAPSLVLQENGFNPYLNYAGKRFNFLAEYHYVYMSVLKGSYPSRTGLNALSAEFAVNTFVKSKRLAPYVRYDLINLPEDGGAYYGLRKIDDETLAKVYTPGLNLLVGGIAYDLTHFNRIKLEYVHHLDGPWKSQGIFLQTAFGF